MNFIVQPMEKVTSFDSCEFELSAADRAHIPSFDPSVFARYPSSTVQCVLRYCSNPEGFQAPMDRRSLCYAMLLAANLNMQPLVTRLSNAVADIILREIDQETNGEPV